MKQYHHISEAERNHIVALVNRGKSFREIGKEIGRSPGTISREIKRNRGKTRYRAHCAQVRAVDKQRTGHVRIRLKSHALRIMVEECLNKSWSPELIAGHLKHRTDLPHISPESIYQWIYQDAPHLIGRLVRHHQARWPKGKSKHARYQRIVSRTAISQRPTEANNRTQSGHCETDQIVGSGRSGLQVLVERKHRLTKIRKVCNKTSMESHRALQDIIGTFPPGTLLSITYDNGIENMEHTRINTEFHIASFFCEPYHSWEKGTVENTNGLIRRFFPKKTNFDTVTDAEIQQVEKWLNDRPRKCLGFISSNMSFASSVALTP